MNTSRFRSVKLLTSLLATALIASNAVGQDNPLRFQRPTHIGQPINQANAQKFRAPATQRSTQQAAPVTQQAVSSAPQRPIAKKVAEKPETKSQPTSTARQPKQVVKKPVKKDTQLRRAQNETVESDALEPIPMEVHSDAETWQEEPIYMDTVDAHARHRHMAMGRPHMNGCQCDTCMCDPSCGMVDPGCGIADPSCGCAEPNCGSCVGIPGPDYWCVPICFPRIKDLTFWGGVHGFRGPRDFIPAGQSNSNFGFQEGFNFSGRAPYVGFLFPELSYQVGFQALQSRLYGTDSSNDSRGQQFVTAGLFRRTQAGLQFGVVFDSMSDDLNQDIDLNQVRYELSLKTPRGRELGFWGANSTNSESIGANTFATVDQYCGFYRWNFKDGYQGRIWGGGTGDGEGIIGADFYAPITDRWSLQTGFNFLLPNEDPGPAGVAQESWNIGINLVWHMGCTAKKGARSPFRPLFSVADNGWMFVDRVD